MSFAITPEGQVIAVVSVALSIMSLTVRKLVLDQEKLKKDKEGIKRLQKEMKEAQKAGETKRMSEMTKEIMSLNSRMMKQSFKPMIFTIIPFLIVFSWMGGAYDHTLTTVVLWNPLPEGVMLQDVSVSDDGFYNKTANMLVWRFERIESSNSSTLKAQFSTQDTGADFTQPAVIYSKKVRGVPLIGTDVNEPIESNSSNDIVFLKTVERQGNLVEVELFYNNTKSNIIASLLGFDLGWLGWYILCSMTSSILLNKIFKVA